MTSIKLTEAHKAKLLEMCKELFPEYTIYSADNDGFIEGEQWVGDQNMGEDRPVNEFNIHWFEFCIIKLYPILKINGTISYHSLIRGDNHIVDALYEEFKKLNK